MSLAAENIFALASLRLAISSAEKLFHWRGRLVASSESKSSTELRKALKPKVLSAVMRSPLPPFFA